MYGKRATSINFQIFKHNMDIIRLVMSDLEEINLFLKEASLYLESLEMIYQVHTNMLSDDFLDKVKIIYEPYGTFYLEWIYNGKRFLYKYKDNQIFPYLKVGYQIKSNLLIMNITSKNKYYIPDEKQEIHKLCIYETKDKSDEIKHYIQTDETLWLDWRYGVFLRQIPFTKPSIPNDICDFDYIEKDKKYVMAQTKAFIIPYILEICYVVDVADMIFGYYL